MPDPAPTADTSASLVQSIVGQIFNSSNWKSEVTKTVKKNVKLQELLRETKAQLELAKKGAPADGAKVLSKEEAAEWDAFKALNLKPTEIKKVTEDHARLLGEEQGRKEEESYGDAAEALDFSNVPAFKRWMKREGLVLEMRDQRVEDEETGKKITIKMPFIRPKADEKAQFEPLQEYVEREVPEFVATFQLTPEEAATEETEEIGQTDGLIRQASRDADSRVKSGNGVRVPAMRSGRSDTTPSSRDKKVLEDMENSARANPLYSI